MRYFVRFSYVGTEFHGSQVQPNGVTVQEVMENAFATLLRQPVSLTFAGRTDAGVHASEMWAHWDWSLDETHSSLPALSKLIARLNSLLPLSIAVQQIFPVREDAHARYSATERTYCYHITTRKDPFAAGRVARVAPGLDFGAMNEAAQLLLGKHDFASFCKVHTDVKTTFCTVTRAVWEYAEEGQVVFTIVADRFLRNMVRAVVGTLLEVGRGRMTIGQFADVLAAKNRSAAGQSAPAEGLYLVRVAYPDTIYLNE